VAERASAYGIPGCIVDGMDVMAVFQAAAEAIAACRAGRGPILLECKTYRFIGHSRTDARGYRSKEEEAEWKERDHITRLARTLAAAGVAQATLSQLESEVTAEIDDAVEYARSSPDATPDQAFEGVYA